MTKIFIDCGHGGKDSGASANGIKEKDIVLDLGKRIEKLLKDYKNVDVMLSRSTDVYLTLSERTNKANNWGADCLISLHNNGAESTSAKGFETFIYNGTVKPATSAFQNMLHTEIMRSIGNIQDRGKKRANFHMLRESRMVAVLTENLFVSNSGDANLLKDNSFLDKLARGHVIGLEKFFGLERVIRPPVTEKPDTGESDALYQVIAGTFSERANAEKQVERLKADGYKAYINKK